MVRYGINSIRLTYVDTARAMTIVRDSYRDRAASSQ